MANAAMEDHTPQPAAIIQDDEMGRKPYPIHYDDGRIGRNWNIRTIISMYMLLENTYPTFKQTTSITNFLNTIKGNKKMFKQVSELLSEEGFGVHNNEGMISVSLKDDNFDGFENPVFPDLEM